VKRLSLNDYRKRLKKMEHERARILDRCTSNLEALIPESFAEYFRDYSFAGNTLGVPNSLRFNQWVEELIEVQKLEMRFDYDDFITHRRRYDWKSMNDIEVDFEDLAKAWKPLVTVTVNAITDKSVKAKPPIWRIRVHFEVA